MSRTNRVVAAGASLAIISAVFVACFDLPTPPSVAGARGTVTKAKPLTPNRMAWVGQAHNRALDELFSRADHGRGKRGNVCTRFIAALMGTNTMKSVRFQDGYSDSLMAESMKAGLKTGKCAEWRESFRRGNVKVRPALYSPAPIVALPETYAVSAAVQEQLDAITAKIDQATTAADYDVLIDPVIQAAATFGDTLDQAVILSSAALASSSAHYWEANYDAQMSTLIAAARADFSASPECVPEYVDGEWTVPVECLDGGGDVTTTGGLRVHAAMPSPSVGSQRFRFATLVSAARNAAEEACIKDWEGDGTWRTTVKRDAIGAITGAIVGSIAGKSWQATLMGALGGGLASSAADSLWRAGVVAFCEWYY